MNAKNISRTKVSRHDRVLEAEFERHLKRGVIEYDLWVCRAYALIAGGYTEQAAGRHLAVEMATMPAEVAEAVSHAAECHRALSGRLGRPNRGGRRVA
jgi:hypothetical protein